MLGSFGLRWFRKPAITKVNFRKGLLFSFILGLVVRLIPEILSYPYPIGFDTLYYAVKISKGIVWYNWASVFSTWLLYAIVIPLNNIVQNPFLSLKIAVPVIFALNSCGIYYFAINALRWSPRKGLAASFLFVFSIASLGLSWHFHRSMLGLAILLFALSFITKIKTRRGFAGFAFLSVLVILSHEFVAVVFFAVISGLLLIHFLRGERKELLRLASSIAIASFVFLINVYLILRPVPVNAPTNVVYAKDITYPHPVGLFFMVDYLRVDLPFMHYQTYLDLVLHVISLFSLLYLVLMPLVLVGFFRNRLLSVWTTFLLATSFDALITPFFAVDFWYRWMLMLIYPFVFYAVDGAAKVLKSQSNRAVLDRKGFRWIKVSRRAVFTIVLLTVLLGSIFMSTPLIYDRFGVFSIPTTYNYVPSTMLYNTIPLRDVDSVIESLHWLNAHMNSNSTVILQQALVWWGELYLDKKNTIICYQVDVEKGLDLALERGFDQVYLIWWNQNIGWYGITVPKSFIPIASSDRISVFEFQPAQVGELL